jgi:hypothetical protein
MAKENLMSAVTSNSIIWSCPSFEAVVRPEPVSAENIPATNQWLDRERDLKAIRRYREDWDGFGAEAPDQSLVDVAINFLHCLRARNEMLPPMRISLSSDGMLAMEWQHGELFLRAEISNLNEVEWMRVIPGRQTEFTTEPIVDRPDQTREHGWKRPSKYATDAAGLSYAG